MMTHLQFSKLSIGKQMIQGNIMFGRIGKNIKALRHKAKITQSDLAAKLGVSRQQIANYEKGNVTIPLKSVVEMSMIFDVSIDDFIKKEFFLMKSQTTSKRIVLDQDRIQKYVEIAIKKNIASLDAKINLILKYHENSG